jgi:2-methylcitrate dehydratase PrpD
MNYTEQVADFIVRSKVQKLPEEVIQQAKLLILDTLGCGVGGYCTNVGKQIVTMAKGFSNSEGASLIGEGSKVSEVIACWANSSLTNLMDMDETFSGVAHIGNCVVPTALGIGEVSKASGATVVHALVLGFEVASRILHYIWPTPAKGVRTYFPSTLQVLAAVTVAGKLLGLDKTELVNAFGLAGTVPPLPIDMKKFVERPMGFGKNPFGWTTFTGVFWTQLAQMGMRGTPNILDGDAGFWAIMGSDQCHFEKLSEGLGEKYHIMDTKFKPYPSCTWGHSTLDATKKISRQYQLKAEDIKEVNIWTLERAVQFLSDLKIETIFDAQFSLPYAIAMVLLNQKEGPEWMSEENMFHNVKVKKIEEKVRLFIDPEAEKLFFQENGEAMLSTVEIKTKGNGTFLEKVKYPKGSPRNPLTEEELIEKFKTVGSSLLGPKRIDTILKLINGLEKLEEISTLTGLLSGQE